MIERFLCRGFHQTQRGKSIIYIDDQRIKGIWYEGYVYPKKSNENITYYILTVDEEGTITGKKHKVMPETIGMYSGFNDTTTGKKIFEYDIVDGDYKYIHDKKKRFVVKWERGSFIELTNHTFCTHILVGSMFDKNWDEILEEGFNFHKEHRETESTTKPVYFKDNDMAEYKCNTCEFLIPDGKGNKICAGRNDYYGVPTDKIPEKIKNNCEEYEISFTEFMKNNVSTEK